MEHSKYAFTANRNFFAESGDAMRSNAVIHSRQPEERGRGTDPFAAQVTAAAGTEVCLRSNY